MDRPSARCDARWEFPEGRRAARRHPQPTVVCCTLDFGRVRILIGAHGRDLVSGFGSIEFSDASQPDDDQWVTMGSPVIAWGQSAGPRTRNRFDSPTPRIGNHALLPRLFEMGANLPPAFQDRPRRRGNVHFVVDRRPGLPDGLTGRGSCGRSIEGCGRHREGNSGCRW